MYNSTLSSVEGCATMADANGQLLFYSNGVTINNRQHKPMKNGTGLLGDLSSTDNVVIVPLPGSSTIYYVFTVGSQRQTEKGFRYTVVDMNGDLGLGEVIQKNILIETESFEKLAAVHHCNKRDVWVTIRKWDTNEYHTYQVNAAGVNSTPVVSHGNILPLNPIGTLKFSANGKKLVAVYAYESNEIELMDFDNTTGVLSNAIDFKPESGPATPDVSDAKAYGAEFSPGGNLLYISANHSDTGPSTLYQFNITSGNAATILASKQVIAQVYPWVTGGLQLAPDQQIYMAMGKDTSISVIENPDVYGPGCNFRYNKIYLNEKNNALVQYGLPNFIQSYFDPRSFYDFSRSGNCTDLQVKFTLNKTLGIDSVKWDFGDGQKSTQLSPVNNYAAPGFYTVNLDVYKNDCSGSLFETISHQIWIAASNTFLGKDTSSCEPLGLQIGVTDIPGIDYLWNTGSNDSKIITTDFGLYWLELAQNGCSIRDSISFTAKPKPVVNLGPDTTVCKTKPVVIKAGTGGYDSYLWSTGETTASILIKEVGKYYVTVTKDQCQASDTVLVGPGDCGVFIPSAFTPNNDNLNEAFGVVDHVALQYYSMQIYSKWGQLVFSSNDVTKKWDGTFKGKKMPMGSYLWMLNYTNTRGRKFYEQGMVQLIR